MISTQGASRVRTAQLEAECLQLRMEGHSHREIAARMGVAPSTAYKRIRHGLNEMNKRNVESAAELRTLESCRLDELQNAIWEKALAGDLKAVRSVLLIMERRARLLGLDAPTRAQHEVTVATAEDRERLIEELAHEALAAAGFEIEGILAG